MEASSKYLEHESIEEKPQRRKKESKERKKDDILSSRIRFLFPVDIPQVVEESRENHITNQLALISQDLVDFKWKSMMRLEEELDF